MPANDDDHLLGELRRILKTVDPVPERVLVDARSACRWRAGAQPAEPGGAAADQLD
jgi:hypothetical protein